MNLPRHAIAIGLAATLAVTCCGCGDGSPLPETPASASPSTARTDAAPPDDAARIVPPYTRGSLSMNADGSFSAGWSVNGNGGESRKATFPELIGILAQFPKMKLLWIYLSDDGLTTAQYRQIAKLHSVESIVIQQYGAFEGATLAPLAQMPNLTSLEIIEAWVDPEILQTLVRFPRLKDFLVGSGYSLTEEARRLGVRFRIHRTNNYEP